MQPKSALRLRTGHLGNDIVDLTMPEARGKASHRGFVRRVCSQREQDWLHAQPNPTLGLWQLFAAKEATYKAFKKRSPETGSSLRSIAVDVDRCRSDVQGCPAQLTFEDSDSYVHCLAWLGEGTSQRWERLVHGVVRIHLDEEYTHGSSQLSRRLRQLARRELRQHKAGEIEFRRDPGPERWRPPRAYCSGRVVSDLEVSFSHDGRFGAVVVGRSLLGQR